jgi:hypothetical protein
MLAGILLTSSNYYIRYFWQRFFFAALGAPGVGQQFVAELTYTLTES